MNFYTGSGAYNTNLDASGNYAISLPSGEVTVTIDTEPFNKKSPPTYGGKSMPASPKPEGVNTGPQPGPYVQIPKKYTDKDKSGLKFTVTTGKQTQDLDLKD